MRNNRRSLYFIPLLLIVAWVSISHSSAQNFRPPTNTQGGFQTGQGMGMGQIPQNMGFNQKADTASAKPPRKRKPLESFYFSDSLRQRRIFAWTTSLSNNNITNQEVDTLLPMFSSDYKFQRNDVGYIYLGNIGSAAIPVNYFNRLQGGNFSFLNVWKPYMMNPENILFYNAKTPYTRLSYSMSGAAKQEETMFDLILSHNISPSTTFNFEYHANATGGEYLRQRTLARFFDISFAHTGKRYAVHGGYIFNHGDIEENGGIQDDKLITDTVVSLQTDIPVSLNNAKNKYRGHTFWISQSYGIPLRKQKDDELTIQKIPSIFLGISAEYTKIGKRYTDDGAMDYYKSANIDNKQSSDSIGQSHINLRAFAQIQPYNRDGLLGLITGGLGNEVNSYYLADTVPPTFRPTYGEGGSSEKNTTYLYGSAEGAFRKYLRWGASLRYNLFGYKAGDFVIDGSLKATAFIKERPISLDASVQFSLREPDFWTQTYFSNHFAWANSFQKESTTTFNARLLAESIGLEIGGNYQLVQNKIYYGADMLPAQSREPLSVMGIYLRKDFRLGGFRLNHRVLAQWSTQQEVAPVPAFSAYLSYFFEFDVVPKVLRMQLGLDARYYTKFYSFGYNPAVSQFYNQREKELGDYPYVDFFAAGKWKRMRILIKLQHLNANLTENRNYFLALHHPVNRMMFKLGISWSFYD